jgi:hypothetical protein
MLRQAELRRVLGRRLTERLLRAGWIDPIQVNGRIFYEKRVVRLALKRVQNEGFLLSSLVRSVSVSGKPKVPKRSLEDALADLDLSDVL